MRDTKLRSTYILISKTYHYTTPKRHSAKATQGASAVIDEKTRMANGLQHSVRFERPRYSVQRNTREPFFIYLSRFLDQETKMVFSVFESSCHLLTI